MASSLLEVVKPDKIREAAADKVAKGKEAIGHALASGQQAATDILNTASRDVHQYIAQPTIIPIDLDGTGTKLGWRDICTGLRDKITRGHSLEDRITKAFGDATVNALQGPAHDPVLIAGTLLGRPIQLTYTNGSKAVINQIFKHQSEVEDELRGTIRESLIDEVSRTRQFQQLSPQAQTAMLAGLNRATSKDFLAVLLVRQNDTDFTIATSFDSEKFSHEAMQLMLSGVTDRFHRRTR